VDVISGPGFGFWKVGNYIIVLVVHACVLGVDIFGSKSTYLLESKLNVSCYSNLMVLSILWRDAISNEVVFNNSKRQSLILHIESVTLQMNKRRYICEVTFLLPGNRVAMEAKDFTLIITGNASGLKWTIIFHNLFNVVFYWFFQFFSFLI